MSSRVYKSKTVVPKETFVTAVNPEDAIEQKCRVEETKRANLNKKRAEEGKTIHTIATRKVEKQEAIQDELAIPGNDDYDRALTNATKGSSLYSRRSNKALLSTLSSRSSVNSICKEPISREELTKYIEKVLPDYFSFGDIPSDLSVGASCVAYHVKRLRTQQVPVYSMSTSSLVRIPTRLEKYSSTRPTREADLKYSRGLIEKDEEKRYTPRFKYLYDPDVVIEQNTVRGILENYTPGMVLDPSILIGVLRNRLNCTSSLHGYSENRSYNIFEGYLAAGLELKEEAPLVYLIGIFDYPSTGRNLYDTCVVEDRNCEDNLIDTISDIRDIYWGPNSEGENDPKAPESLRR